MIYPIEKFEFEFKSFNKQSVFSDFVVKLSDNFVKNCSDFKSSV